MSVEGLVTVVIPNHNYAQYVGQAVESVLEQTYRPVEVIVVDNGSTDASLEVLAAYADRCRILPQADLGQSAGRNRGIREARGELIAFLDADDVWRPEKLERQMECLARDPEVALVYCSLEIVDPELQPTGEVVRASSRGDALESFARWPGRAIVVGGESTAIVRRAALDAVGPFFEPTLSISGGWDLWRRVATRHQIDYVPETLVLYRQHGSSQHRRLAAYESDVRAASARMFQDPAAARVWRFRRTYEAGLDLMFAKTWLRHGDLWRAAILAARALAVWTTSVRDRLARRPDGGVGRERP